MEKELPKPDLVIYLQSKTERLLANIKKRRIDYEKHISIEYLKRLNEAYNAYFFKYSETPLLVINATAIDFVNNEDDLNDLVNQVLTPPSGMKYYVPRKG
jgi:deoxyadenosine/deoxycytidine kinase